MLHAWLQPYYEQFVNTLLQGRLPNSIIISGHEGLGGNALAYRSLLPVAVMYSSVPMLDVLAEVCQRGISMTSQITYDDSFWTEGFTADGAAPGFPCVWQDRRGFCPARFWRGDRHRLSEEV